MKMLRNRTAMPLRIHLPASKVLHLGPGRTGRVSDDALNHPSVARLLRDGALVLEEEAGSNGAPASTGHALPHGAEHGHDPVKVVHTTGDR